MSLLPVEAADSIEFKGSQKSSSATYIKHIDGLRAIAVLLVFMNHLKVPIFSGGFVGVDIFFVISGFLITRLIVKELEETGSFSFTNFYLRRFKRIVPALMFTLLFSFIAAASLMAAEHFKLFGQSMATSILSVSNIFFWMESGYFEMESQLKPLLNTWSLGVEEQFYMVWPPLLALFFWYVTKIHLSGLVIVLFMASLQLNLFFQDEHQEALYYLMPARIFEFTIGAVLVWAKPKFAQFGKAKLAKKLSLEVTCSTGTMMIMYSAINYDNETVFPSINALVPCIGAALVIVGGNAKFSGQTFQNKVSQWIGLISYSLYLSHWPIIVFYSYYKAQEMNSKEQVTIFTTAIVISSLMYVCIEQPFRKLNPETLKPTYQIAIYAVAMIAVALLGCHIYFFGGWEKMAVQSKNEKGKQFNPMATYLEKRKAFITERYDDHFRIEKFIALVEAQRIRLLPRKGSDCPVVKPPNNSQPGPSIITNYFGGVGVNVPYICRRKRGWLYHHNSTAPADILLTGDSFSNSLQHGLYEILAKPYGISIFHVHTHDCIPIPNFVASWSKAYCQPMMRLNAEIMNRNRNAVLMLFCFWEERFMRKIELDGNLQELTKGLEDFRNLINHRKILIIGHNPLPGRNGPLLCVSRPSLLEKGVCDLTTAYNASMNFHKINSHFRSYAKQTKNVFFIDPFEAFCEKKKFCHNLTPDGVPYHNDYIHLALEGSLHLIATFKEEILSILHS